MKLGLVRHYTLINQTFDFVAASCIVTDSCFLLLCVTEQWLAAKMAAM